MAADRRARRLALLGAALLAGGCRGGAPPPLAPPAPLPSLPVAQADPRPAPAARRAPVDDPLASLPPGRLVTLSARDVDVRTLLSALAENAGASLVLGPEVQGRVSVNLVQLPAREALRAVLEQAGLGVVAGPPAPLWRPVVFYALPVNIEEASAELIQARFGVSPEVARWIVENRLR